jgi:hypothetical protein
MAKKRIYTILGAAVGAGLAVYGIRQGMRWVQQGQYTPVSRSSQGRYQPVDQPDREPIPTTGLMAEAPPMTDRWTAESYTSSVSADIVQDEFVAPLIAHAIAFDSMISMLRSRQQSGEGFEGTESLTSDDRSSIQAMLDEMDLQVTDYDEASMGDNPLARRTDQLTRKLRDALDNPNYSGSDLFRIYGEVLTELCSLTRDLNNSKQGTITGLDHIRQLYKCK